MLDSMQHLQKTNDRPIDEGQDDEQDAKDDEDNASDVDSSIPQSPRSKIPSEPPSQKDALKRRFDVQYDFCMSSQLVFDKLALNCTEFEGIGTDSRNLIEGYRPGLTVGSYTYVRIQLTNSPTSIKNRLKTLLPYIILL